METILSSATRELRIGGDNPFCIIGERINPTGRKIFQEQLRRGDLSRVEIDVAERPVPAAVALADVVGLQDGHRRSFGGRCPEVARTSLMVGASIRP